MTLKTGRGEHRKYRQLAFTDHGAVMARQGELEAKSVCAKFAHTVGDGKIYGVDYFNPDAVEWESSRSQIVILKTGRGTRRKFLPVAFTEHGAVMAATILNSPQPVQMSIRRPRIPRDDVCLKT